MELAWVKPTTFVGTAVARLAMQYEDKGVQLHTDLPDNLPDVKVDPARMTQVMLNLLGNALQYTPPGGEVMVTARAEAQQLILTVQDSGIGLSVDSLPHIFERFYRVDKSRSRAGGGSGVGLTISRHIVEAHNGRLTVTSPDLGQGSTFTLTLPLSD
jgi:histidine kinase